MPNKKPIKKTTSSIPNDNDLPVDLPREKLVKLGVDNLKDYELLAILLRTGTKNKHVLELAKEILQTYKLEHFTGLSAKDLLKIKGIGPEKACTLLASVEFSRRVLDKPKEYLPKIENTRDALVQLKELRDYKKEYLAALYLNARCELIHKEIITIGLVDQVSIHPREVFDPAIRYLASQVILAHNHPSGSLEASSFDLKMTNKLVKSGEILGIEVLDHLIITKDSYKSILIESEQMG